MKATVLVVDDNSELRELIGLRLTLSGIPHLQCNDGMEALEIIRSSRPGIILTDVKMPRMSGFELLKKVREFNSESLFIFLTGDINRNQVNEAIKFGVFDFIEKGSNDRCVETLKMAQKFLSRAI